MTTTSHPVRHSQGHDTARSAHTVAGRAATLAIGVAVALDGVALILLGLLVPTPSLQRLVEVVLGAAVLVPGLLMIRTGLRGNQPLKLGVLPGDVVLAGALFYLGVAMPVFHDGNLSYSAGVSQFMVVLVGLALGSVALALSGATTPPKPAASVDPPAAVRDGVILIVGTILVAIALSQLGLARLTPPMWNWISFLAITIPGMLILVAREFVKQVRRSQRPGTRPRLFGLLMTEAMLFGGLWVMIYGSGANLTLGKNGYTTGFKGDTDGLTLVVVAVVVLIVARAILPQPTSAAPVSRAILRKIVYALGVIAFIYGERSVVIGKSPAIVFGAAAPAAAVILAAGLAVLIAGRIIAHPAAPSHPELSAPRRVDLVGAPLTQPGARTGSALPDQVVRPTEGSWPSR